MIGHPGALRRVWGRALGLLARSHLEWVFLFVALSWGIAQVFLVPPLQVPDEEAHWYRAWAVTEGQLFADRAGEVTLPASFGPVNDLIARIEGDVGNPLPVSMEGQPGFSGYAQLFNQTQLTGTISIACRVRAYGPVGYVPQAVGIGVGRLLGAQPLTCFYLARLANLLFSVLLLFYAIRLAPFGKQLFLLFALLPMTMFELASVSCDALTLAGSMLFISLALSASLRDRLARSEIALLILSAALLLNIKPGYWALVLLLFLIRPSQLGGTKRYTAFIVGAVMSVLAVFVLTWFATATDTRLTGLGVTDPLGQLSFIVHDPVTFLTIVWSNLKVYLLVWIQQTIGTLGWLNIYFAQTFYVVVLVAGLTFFMSMKEAVPLSHWRRLLLLAIGLLVFMTLILAVYVFLEPVGGSRVFIQGRYLAPVWLVLMLSAYGIDFVQRHWRTLFIVTVVLVMLAQNFHTLMAYYHP